MAISCIILASGESKRMGKNKLLLELNGKMIFEYIFDTIKNIQFEEVIVVTRFKEIEDYSKRLGYKILYNKNYSKGQSSSIKIGVNNTNKKNDYIFFVADQPMISLETIKKLLDAYKKYENQIIIPVYDGIKGNPVIFPNYFREDLLKLTGDSGGRKIIKENTHVIKKIDINNDENIDIDTLEDYESIRRKYGR
ncbi:molybdenum cofactor cytidylyltransferase [Miniphocaeibacter massiliensis]|uniref:molybdenum cofactor cytidylyltransferase n=1 Tax=Miniphocaeibacter massiliensis TaxID=2041841 RepID=UPI000C1C24D1|nr:molybdenum cofactor cytidylyltransferase [Miniphocaeibacter massiliensis]